MTEATPPIIFVRHGETDWNRAKRIQGRADIGLNELGQAQAAAVGRRIRHLIVNPDDYEFHSSPMRRARDTMALILAEVEVAGAPVHYDERLRERAFGSFDGCAWSELFEAAGDPAVDPERYYSWQPPDGESYAQLGERVGQWLACLSRPAIVVSHSGVSRALRGILLGLARRDIVHLPVPQDRFFRVAQRELEWFDAREGWP